MKSIWFLLCYFFAWAAAGANGAGIYLLGGGDHTSPTVTNVTSSTANGTYFAGDTIAVQVTFSETVTVGGTPQLTLETGSIDAVVNYASGSGTDTLVFNYTPGSEEYSADLDYKATSSLALNGGLIKDGWNNAAVLTLPAPGATGSLGANKALVVWSPDHNTESVTIDVMLDASATTKVTGSPASQITDRGPGAYTYSAAGGARPTISSLNSRQAFDCDGVANRMIMDSPTRFLPEGVTNSAFVVWGAGRIDTFPTHYPRFFIDGDGTNRAWQIFPSDDSPYTDISIGHNIGLAHVRAQYSPSLPQAFTFVIVYAGSPNNETGYTWTINNSGRTSLASSAYAANTNSGRICDGNGASFFDGLFGEVGIAHTSNATFITNTKNYVYRKWGH